MLKFTTTAKMELEKASLISSFPVSEYEAAVRSLCGYGRAFKQIEKIKNNPKSKAPNFNNRHNRRKNAKLNSK